MILRALTRLAGRLYDFPVKNRPMRRNEGASSIKIYEVFFVANRFMFSFLFSKLSDSDSCPLRNARITRMIGLEE
jgi:hypothetical protein